MTLGIGGVKFPLMITVNRTQTPSLSIPRQREASVTELTAANTTDAWHDRRIAEYVVQPSAFLGLSGAACRQPGVDPDMWFSDPQNDYGSRGMLAAQFACLGCPVKAACLKLGIDNDVDAMSAGLGRIGVWGGWTASMRSRRGRAALGLPTPAVWAHVRDNLSAGNWPGPMAGSSQYRPLATNTVRNVINAVVRHTNPWPGTVSDW